MVHTIHKSIRVNYVTSLDKKSDKMETIQTREIFIRFLVFLNLL